ncbi:MAG: rod shape-determining protein MreD, partial [Gammaproteobacteria bacterium]
MNPLVRRQSYGIILLSLFTAWVLSVLPLPEAFRPWRPEWPLLVLVYWSLALPHRVNLGTAWITGLVQDLLVGTLLGQHALAYAV